jgi:hypothetical protein
MSFETTALDRIEKHFHKADRTKPNMHWQYGTLWIETESKEDLDIVKTAMKEDVLASNLDVQFSEMKPTDREPWTEWAMDVVGFRG